MSGFAAEPARKDERTGYASSHYGAQAHYPRRRRAVPDTDASDEQDSMTIVERDGETDISASQKMLSAVSGSLLTSLLGKMTRALKR